MRLFRKALIIVCALIVLVAVWLWWNSPSKVDMAAYVPADSLIYIEANDLPQIASGLVSTDAWKALAPQAGIRSDLGYIGSLSKLASWTGIGSAEAVVFSRSQIAVAVLGFDAADSGDTLKIKPRYAVVIETHTGESRTRYVIEKHVGDFARRAYGDPRVESKEADGVRLITWSEVDGERYIVAATSGSVAIVGNDEAAVRACLAVRRNERPSLIGNPSLEEMRSRFSGKDALAFGYASPEGAARLLELRAITYAGQLSSDPRAQSAAASLLPGLARKVLGRVGWSAHLTDGLIEDRYFLALENGVADRLQAALTARNDAALAASELLPANTYSISRYSYSDPSSAWRGLNATITSQFDTLGSILIARLLKAWLNRYGIEDPDNFLQAMGADLVTANLDDSESGTVTIVEVRDEKTLRDFVARRLGAKPRSEKIGDSEMLVSNNDKRDAASFVAGNLILGKAENVRRCLEARGTNQTLSKSDNFKRTLRSIAGNSPIVVSYTNDQAPARALIMAIAKQKAATDRPMNQANLENGLGQLRYAVSETRLERAGFERITRSSFGQFGLLVSQFVPGG